MTNQHTARLMGDPPYRSDAYADVVDAMGHELSQQQARVALDQNWRSEYKARIQRDLLNANPSAQSLEHQARQLWNDGNPIGAITERTGLTIGQVYEIVSAECP